MNVGHLLGSINDRWLDADRTVSASQWSNTRLLALGLLLVGPHIPRLGAVADVPESLLDSTLRLPAGVLAGGPSQLLAALALLPVLTACIALAGIRTRLFGVLTAVLLVVGNSMLYSIEGKIVHHQWTAIAIGIMSWTIWSARSTFSGTWSPRLVLAWLMAWGLSTSALVKVRGGWLDPGFSAVRSELEHQAVRQGRFTAANGFLRDVFENSFLWEIADYGTVAIEVALLVAILRPALFRLAVVALTLFHLGILLLLGISFVGVLPAYVPFIAEFMPARALSRRSSSIAAVVLGVGVGAAVILHVPDFTPWVLSAIPIPLYLASGVALLLFPALAVRGAVLQRRLGIAGADRTTGT